MPIPPSLPKRSSSGFQARLSFNASGTVDEYDTVRREQLLSAIIRVAGLASRDGVTLTILPASVRVEVLFDVQSEAALTSVRTSLASNLATVDAASTALGLTVESLPAVTEVADAASAGPTAPLITGDSTSNLETGDTPGGAGGVDATGLIVGVVAGVIACCALAVAARVLWKRRSKRENFRARFQTQPTMVLAVPPGVVNSPMMSAPLDAASCMTTTHTGMFVTPPNPFTTPNHPAVEDVRRERVEAKVEEPTAEKAEELHDRI